MSTPSDARPDRRHLRRAETISQIVDVAMQVMGEHGVAGLSLGEVARRMGIRPPSLYVYFDSKNAVYDAVFARGWAEIRPAMEAVGLPDSETSDLPGYLLEFGRACVRWSVEHPVHTQLMGWRAVPGYEPSAAAYEPAQASFERGRAVFTRLVELGLLTPDVPADEMFRVWTTLISGVITQQLANAPHERFAEGTFTTLLPPLVAMYSTHYGARTSPARTPTTRRSTASRRRHADQR